MSTSSFEMLLNMINMIEKNM